MKPFVSIVALSALEAPAFAGGPSVVASEPEPYVPAPEVLAPVSGNWEGFYAGVNLGYGDFDGELSGSNVYKADGMIGGLQAGYRWDFGQTVLGLEAAYSGADLKDDATGDKLKNKTDLKLQLGYDLGQSLIYATAGASWAKASIGGSDFSDNGWVAGLGYDYALNENWTVGAEYLYHKYDDFDDTGIDLDGNTFALRANYKF